MSASLVLARKYRPKSFLEMVGQDTVVRALSNALESRRLHHAYLFTGTRGVGKTTVSRILAKSLNCVGPDGQGDITPQPCGQCEPCRAIDAGRFVDYTELDAASNRSVAEMQALLEQAVYKPVEGRFKVFMIDEVHMLSGHAFNAMLKTLEEPPEYLTFVLATTDPHKVPVTVLSRCLQFNLRPIAPETVQEHLHTVLTQEGVQAEAGALKLLGKAAQGSMRDALSLTDQALAFSAGDLSETGVRQMLGAVDSSYIYELIEALAHGNGQVVVATVDALRRDGLSAAHALEDMASVLQKMAVYQALGQTPPDLDSDEARIAALAAALPPDETQLLYSLVIHGRAELGLAPDEYAGLCMSLLRLFAFKPDGFRPQTGPLPTPSPVAEAEKKTPEISPAPAAPIPAPVPVAPAPAATPAAEAEPTAPAPAEPESQPEPKPEAKPEAQTQAQPAAAALPEAAAQADAGTEAEAQAQPAALRLPVRDMGEGSARLDQARDAPGDPAAHARWLELVQQLLDADLLQALTRELAVQSECLELSADWCRLKIERSTLQSEQLRERLEAALAELGQPMRLRLELGAVQGSHSQRQSAAANALQQQAEAEFAALPLVQHLQQEWGGKIIAGSVQPRPAASA